MNKRIKKESGKSGHPFLTFDFRKEWLGIPVLYYIRIGKMDTQFLFLNLEKMVSIFPMYYDICCGFVVYSLHKFEVYSFYWFLSKTFPASIEVILCLLFLILFICYTTFVDLHMLKYHCISGMKPFSSWCMIFLICYRIWFESVLLRIFTSIFICNIGF
jgi:hypothetical protein